MKQIFLERAYVLSAQGKPVLEFSARNQLEARQLAREKWLLDDLASQKTEGNPLISQGARLTVRLADLEEKEMFRLAAAGADDGEDQIVLVYLIPLDGPA